MNTCKKAIALILVALMLVGVAPFAALTASGLTYSKSEFLIANLSDWNDVASSSENFVGKTVKLTQNIDAGGATLPTLFDSFGGTFDGQGYTIHNFKTTKAVLAEKTLSGAVIQNLTVDGTVTNDDEGVLATGLLVDQHMDTAAGTLTVSDVTVNGSVQSRAQQVGALFGVLTLRDGQTATLKNIKVGARVTNNRVDLTHACISAGGVAGIFEPLGCPELTVKGVQMTGEVIGGTSTAGGIFGSVFSSDYLEDLYAGGSITISNCAISGKVKSSVTNTVQGVGGIIGSFGAVRRDC